MLKAIFNKEWLKLRLFWIIAISANTAVVTFILLSLRSTLLASGVVETWATMIGRDMLFVGQLEFVPLVTGIVLAVCQWIPEMQIKRIRLTLHLPIDYTKSIGMMLLSSLSGLILLFAFDAISLAIIEQIWLPRELILRTFLTCLPWYLGGLIAYSVTSWIILEPQWRYRCIFIVIGAPLVYLAYLTSQPACYIAFFPWLIVLLLLTSCLPFYSIYRFKLGLQ